MYLHRAQEWSKIAHLCPHASESAFGDDVGACSISAMVLAGQTRTIVALSATVAVCLVVRRVRTFRASWRDALERHAWRTPATCPAGRRNGVVRVHRHDE